MQLSISRTLVVIYVAIAVVSFAAIGLVSSWVQERSVATIAASESRRNAELIFQNLYSVMRKGWSKAEITELVSRMNDAIPDIRVAIYRSQQVADAFGEIESDRTIRTSDPEIAATIMTGQERLITMGETPRYIYPVRVGPECRDCHVNAVLGSINGVIDIRFPTNRLRVPLEFTLNSVTWAFIAVIGAIFVLVLLKVRFLVARPITDLARHIDGIVVSGDLSRRVAGRSFQWLSEVRSLAHNFNRLMEELESSRTALVELSTTDPLTGLANRRRFSEALSAEVERSQRYGHGFALIMIDLDGFKPINDRWGHAAGDLVLKAVAGALTVAVRANDLPARLGGDEFIILSPETSAEGARTLADKLTLAIAALRVQAVNAELTVGASVGVALFPDQGRTAGELLARADAAMYADKSSRKSLKF
jgi:diguanylate cyclase (GGDEF)-like protein